MEDLPLLSGAGLGSGEGVASANTGRLYGSLTTIKIEDRESIDAIRVSNVAATKRLVAQGASLGRRDDLGGFERSALHHVVSLPEIPKILMAAATRATNRNDRLNNRDKLDASAIQTSIEGSAFEIVEALIIQAGVSLHNINENGDSALHVAAGEEDPSYLKYLLDNKEQLNIKNTASEKGRMFPIHTAAQFNRVESMDLLIKSFGDEQLTWRDQLDNTVLHIVAIWNSTEVAQYLLTNHTNHFDDIKNSVNKDRETPLYLSAKKNCEERPDQRLITFLLRNGASLSVKGEKESAVNHIARNFADPLTYFEDLFDRCIDEVWIKVTIQYEVLTAPEGMSQIKVIEQLEKCCGSKILKHPLIESLIYMKWECLLPVFYIMIATYMPFLLVLNVFVIVAFSRIDSKCEWAGINATVGEVPREGCACDWPDWMMIAFIYLSIGVLLIQECMWIYLHALRYFMLPESWLRLCVLALASLVAAAGCAARAPASWQRHAACAALLLGWLHALLLLTRFSGWGYYAFERAAINIVKILSMSIGLVLSFATCFMVYYQSNPPFDGPIAAFLKTLVMMTSEFNYGDLFDDKHDMELKDTKAAVRLLFVLFVIFIAVVLMNFMTGVAVSDIKELHDMGNLRRLTKQVEILSTLESLRDTMLGKRWKRLEHLKYLDRICSDVQVPGRIWVKHYVFSASKDVDEHCKHTFESKLHDAIHNVIKKKINKLDDLYDVVVGAPDDVGWLGSNDPERKSLRTRIDLLENSNQEIIQTIGNLSPLMKSIETTNNEIKQSIDDLRKDMEKILGTILCGVYRQNRASD